MPREEDGRTGLVLAAGTSRRSWFTATATLAALGTAWLLAVAGCCLWVGNRAAGGVTAPTLAAAVGSTPAVCVVTGLALVGLALRAGWLGWTALVLSVTLTLVGELWELPGWLVRLSPFSALPDYPVAAWEWTPVFALTAVALGLAAVAWRVFSTRDVM